MFDMVVAGRVVGDDVAIMMVEAEATTETVELVAGGAQAPTEAGRRAGPGGGQAVHPHPVPGPAAAGRRRGQADGRVPDLPGLPARRPRRGLRGRVGRAGRRADHRRQAGARVAHRRGQGRRAGRARRAVRGPREGARRRVPGAEQEAGAPAHPARPGAHRRPRHHRHPAAVGRGRGRPAGPRLGAVRARRDPDHGRHHAEHAAHGAADRLARPGDAQALPAPLQLPALLHRRDRPGRLAEAPRDRARCAGRAGAAAGAAHPRGVPLRDPAGVGGAELQRLHVDGLGLRVHDVAAQRGRAAEGAGGRHRHGPGVRRGRRLHPVRGAHRHPGRRGRVRRHGLQGRRHARSSSPRCSWTPSSTASRPRCWPRR